MKKVVSLLLIVVLALGMVTVSSAASNKVKAIGAGSWTGDALTVSDLVPGDEPTWDFDMDTFDFDKDVAWGTISKTQLERIFRNSVTVRARIVDGDGNPFSAGLDFEVIDSGIKSGTTPTEDNYFLRVTASTPDPYCSIKTLEAEVVFYFVVDGKRTEDELSWNWDGEFANPIAEVYSDTYEVDTYDGTVAEAKEVVKEIILNGGPEGYGVTATVRMPKGKKIYFRVNNDSEDIDDAIFDRYKSIFEVYGVCQVGLDSYTGNFVEFTQADATDYIYGLGTDGSLVYLGRGNDEIPLYKRYYLSNAKIEIEEPVDDEPIDDEVPDNYNPGTGR